MPFVRITLSETIAPSAAAVLADDLTRLMADTLGKRADLTSVLVERAAGGWFIGAAPCAAAHLEAVITAGTNDAGEKERFLAQADAALRRACPDLKEATYTVIREVPAGDWGYGGRSQQSRRADAAKL